MAKAKSVRSTPRRTAVEKLISEHLSAMRADRRFRKKVEALYKRHPDLEDPRPLIHIHTDGDGRKVFGRWTDDFEAVFPRSKKHREKLIKAANLAFPDHKKKRAAAGIEDAEMLYYKSHSLKVDAFKKVLTHVPHSVHEAGLMARHLIKVLPIEAGGQILGYKFGQGPASLEAWRRRLTLAMYDIETLLRTFAKAA